VNGALQRRGESGLLCRAAKFQRWRQFSGGLAASPPGPAVDPAPLFVPPKREIKHLAAHILPLPGPPVLFFSASTGVKSRSPRPFRPSLPSFPQEMPPQSSAPVDAGQATPTRCTDALRSADRLLRAAGGGTRVEQSPVGTSAAAEVVTDLAIGLLPACARRLQRRHAWLFECCLSLFEGPAMPPCPVGGLACSIACPALEGGSR